MNMNKQNNSQKRGQCMKNKVLSDKSPTDNPYAARIAAANGVTYKQYHTQHTPLAYAYAVPHSNRYVHTIRA